jgi:hypothetical protein
LFAEGVTKPFSFYYFHFLLRKKKMKINMESSGVGGNQLASNWEFREVPLVSSGRHLASGPAV